MQKQIAGRTLTMQQWLLLTCSFSCLLLASRIILTGKTTYIFMAWNLFLAVIPYAISQLLSTRPQLIENRKWLWSLLFCWLLFIPNSFYLLTDLFHLDEIQSAPKWFDLLLLFSFAWSGLLLGVVSIARVEMIVSIVSGRKFSLFIVFLVMCLNAFGIYIGRYLRFNSWDIIAQPFTLFGEMAEVIFHPLQNKLEWGMIVVYALFLTMIYGTMKRLSQGFDIK